MAASAEAAEGRDWSELHRGIRELFSDEYDRAEQIFLSRERPLYKLGAVLVGFLRALLTWGQEDSAEAKATIKQCEALVEAQQKANDVAAGACAAFVFARTPSRVVVNSFHHPLGRSFARLFRSVVRSFARFAARGALAVGSLPAVFD